MNEKLILQDIGRWMEVEEVEGSSSVTEMFLFLDEVGLIWEHEYHIWGTSYLLVKWKDL